MIQKMPAADDSQPNPLTVEEQGILEELQRLAAAGCEEVPPELLDRIEQTVKWSYDDPASLERAAFFMAHDPFLRREAQAINEEFSVADGDGLEDC